MFIFGKKPKDPAAIVKSLKETLVLMDKNPVRVDKTAETGASHLQSMKVILVGDVENEPNPDLGLQLAQESFNNDIFPTLIVQLPKLDFEARKDAAVVFNNCLRKQQGNRQIGVDYVCKNPSILSQLILGYNLPDIAFNCGSMLKTCSAQEPLCKLILNSPNFYNLFDYIQSGNFDVSSDAFGSFKEILLTHKTLTAEFLEANYDSFFERYTQLLKSDNHVVKRQSLKVLGDLLLDRANFNVMTKYISDPENLKLKMNLLRDPSKNVQFESFHIFKVFVANPHKPPPIQKILIRNKKTLITFLQSFHQDNEEDQFNEEKAFLIKQVQALPDKTS